MSNFREQMESLRLAAATVDNSHEERISAEEKVVFDAAVKSLLEGVECEDGPSQAISPNGQPYVQIKSHGSADGDEPDIYHMTLRSAIDDWSRRMKAYLVGKRKIWWRIRPEFDSQPSIFLLDWANPESTPSHPKYYARKQYKIYARLMAE